MNSILMLDETQHTTTLETQDQIKEGLVGENLVVSLAGGLITALTPYGDAEAVTLTPADVDHPHAPQTSYTFSASAAGLYRLKVTASTGVRQLLIRVVPRATLDAIPDAETRTGYGQSPARRLVLRSVVNGCPETWDGSADWFYDGRIRLGAHGVITPQV